MPWDSRGWSKSAEIGNWRSGWLLRTRTRWRRCRQSPSPGESAFLRPCSHWRMGEQGARPYSLALWLEILQPCSKLNQEYSWWSDLLICFVPSNWCIYLIVTNRYDYSPSPKGVRKHDPGYDGAPLHHFTLQSFHIHLMISNLMMIVDTILAVTM